MSLRNRKNQLASRSRQAEKPGGSSQQLMEGEPDSQVSPAQPAPCQNRWHIRVWVAESPQVQAGEWLHLSGRKQAGQLPKSHPSQAGTCCLVLQGRGKSQALGSHTHTLP